MFLSSANHPTDSREIQMTVFNVYGMVVESAKDDLTNLELMNHVLTTFDLKTNWLSDITIDMSEELICGFKDRCFLLQMMILNPSKSSSHLPFGALRSNMPKLRIQRSSSFDFPLSKLSHKEMTLIKYMTDIIFHPSNSKKTCEMAYSECLKLAMVDDNWLKDICRHKISKKLDVETDMSILEEIRINDNKLIKCKSIIKNLTRIDDVKLDLALSWTSHSLDRKIIRIASDIMRLSDIYESTNDVLNIATSKFGTNEKWLKKMLNMMDRKDDFSLIHESLMIILYALIFSESKSKHVKILLPIIHHKELRYSGEMII